MYGGLERAKGGFTTGLGKFRAAWVRDDDGVVELTFGVPAMTEEVLVLSLDGEAVMTVKKADEEEPRKEEVQVSQSSTEVEIAVNASGAEYTVSILTSSASLVKYTQLARRLSTHLLQHAVEASTQS